MLKCEICEYMTDGIQPVTVRTSDGPVTLLMCVACQGNTSSYSPELDTCVGCQDEFEDHELLDCINDMGDDVLLCAECFEEWYDRDKVRRR